MDSVKDTFVTFGEIMLRLKTPGKQKLLQNNILEVSYAGSESNVAISLANFGVKTKFVTALPKNAIGQGAIPFLRGFNVDISDIQFCGERLGIFYLEEGACLRNSKVIYDRSNSSFATSNINKFNWDKIFANAKWFHFSGITPALSLSVANQTIIAINKAREKKILISCDLNYRKKLWKYGKNPSEIMNKIISRIDYLFANEEDIQKTLDISLETQIEGRDLNKKDFEKLSVKVFKKFPNLKLIVITLRESYSVEYNNWSAMCKENTLKPAIFSTKYKLRNIVDRVGAGDSMVAGFIFALNQNMGIKNSLEFGVAASALKHTIYGDINRVSKFEVIDLLKGNKNGRIKR